MPRIFFGLSILLLLVNAGRSTVYGGTFGAQRFSSLTQINRDNVGQLARAWEYRSGDLPSERWGVETTPLKIDTTVYLCPARNILIALDARVRW
ncbi:MAG: quinoprotein glucose dehydrogenase [Halieaceae bacterium]